MANQGWWQTPHLLLAEDDHEERRVTWLELFYDLMFVVIISQLSHYLAEHPTVEGVLAYILLFLPVWWIWLGGTFYNSRFETQDVSIRLGTLLQILALGAMTLFVHDGLGETALPFIFSYLVARLIIISLWLRASYHTPIYRPVSYRYAVGFAVSVVLLVLSFWVAPPWRFLIWGAAVLIDISTPAFTLPHQARLPRLSNSKLPERMGLFVIIVLGEQIVGVVSGAAEQEVTMLTLLTAGLGIVLTFCLWWVYFDYIARRVPRPSVYWLYAWSFLHMPLVMSIAAMSAGSLNLIAHGDAGFTDNVRWLFTGSTAAALFAMAAIEVVLRRDPHDTVDLRTSIGLKVAGGLIALALGAVGGMVGRLPLLLLLLVPFIIQMVYGAYTWFHRDVAVIAADPYKG